MYFLQDYLAAYGGNLLDEWKNCIRDHDMLSARYFFLTKLTAHVNVQSAVMPCKNVSDEGLRVVVVEMFEVTIKAFFYCFVMFFCQMKSCMHLLHFLEFA